VAKVLISVTEIFYEVITEDRENKKKDRAKTTRWVKYKNGDITL